MKTYLTIFFILVVGINYLSYSQIKERNNSNQFYKIIPQEKIYVHINTSFLITGEHLYYKAYCINTKTNKLSNLSKIAYVELIGTDNTQVFKHKIRLESGLGQGDFFIPRSILSGNYKLIAYTQWMRNSGENIFLKNDISIINTFKENQNQILHKIELKDTLIVSKPIEGKKIPDLVFSDLTNGLIELKLNKENFINREKVSLKIKTLNKQASYGNYSISVRKVDPIKIPNRLTAKKYISESLQKNKYLHSKNSNSIYLPELRGELLSGKVIYKDTNLFASNINVALSIPGKEYIFKIANTNESGIFYFHLAKEYENSDATIQIINKERENYIIELDRQTSFVHEHLKFNDFQLTPEMKDFIVQHNIYNQIENAFLSVKPNTTDSIKNIIPFYNGKAEEYILDDYTRFPTIKETVVEIIDQVYITRKNDISTFHVRGNSPIASDVLPLVIVDGLFIQKHNDLIDYNAKKVKRISVVSGNYIYSTHIFFGIISIETITGDYRNILSENYIKNIKLFNPLKNKNYFKQVYEENNKLNRIPDFRSQLLWEPNFILNKKEATISFYTSDNSGNYEICIEGFTNEGKPVSLRKIIGVK